MSIDKITCYFQLLKFRLSLTVVFSAIAGYLLGPNLFDFSEFIRLFFGGFLVTGSANSFNQIWEKDFDRLMERTSKRPLPQRNISVFSAVIFSVFSGVIGLFILYDINQYCAFYGLASILIYVLLYTPLKRISPFSIFIGAIPGAIPFLLGWVANYDFIPMSSKFDSGFGVESGTLFFIQFLWQLPHFIAIAWVLDSQYKKAGFKMMLGGEKGKTASFVAMIFSFLLMFASVSPFVLDTGDLRLSFFSFCAILLLGILFLYMAINLHRFQNDDAAKKLMYASFIYLPAIQIILVIDKYI